MSSISNSQNLIRVQLSTALQQAQSIVGKLASIHGPVDVYTWCEGRGDLPRSGAQFMSHSLFAPLFRQKQDVKFCLCSLKNWSFEKSVAHMEPSTPISDAIRRIHHKALRCIDSLSFFKYCLEFRKDSPFYQYFQKNLPQKMQGVVSPRKEEMRVRDLFDGGSSLFDCIQEKSVGEAYPFMRYVEGYYLIQESVLNAIQMGEETVEIAFVLPNDEHKYYADFSKDIEKMLQIDFGNLLDGMTVHITFEFFEYGSSIEDRPFRVKGDEDVVSDYEISSYFQFLQKPKFVSTLPRDEIHGLNDWMPPQEKDSPGRYLGDGEKIPTIPRDDLHGLNDRLKETSC